MSEFKNEQQAIRQKLLKFSRAINEGYNAQEAQMLALGKKQVSDPDNIYIQIDKDLENIRLDIEEKKSLFGLFKKEGKTNKKLSRQNEQKSKKKTYIEEKKAIKRQNIASNVLKSRLSETLQPPLKDIFSNQSLANVEEQKQDYKEKRTLGVQAEAKTTQAKNDIKIENKSEVLPNKANAKKKERKKSKFLAVLQKIKKSKQNKKDDLKPTLKPVQKVKTLKKENEETQNTKENENLKKINEANLKMQDVKQKQLKLVNLKSPKIISEFESSIQKSKARQIIKKKNQEEDLENLKSTKQGIKKEDLRLQTTISEAQMLHDEGLEVKPLAKFVPKKAKKLDNHDELVDLFPKYEDLTLNNLVRVIFAMVCATVFFGTAIYIRTQIYYDSRDISHLKESENSLLQENKSLKRRLEGMRFQNQIIDYLK